MSHNEVQTPKIFCVSYIPPFPDQTGKWILKIGTLHIFPFQAEAMESFLLSLDWTYISILHSDDTYGREGAHSLNKALSLCVYVQYEISLSMDERLIENVMNELKQVQNFVCFIFTGLSFGQIPRAKNSSWSNKICRTFPRFIKILIIGALPYYDHNHCRLSVQNSEEAKSDGFP